ncbi:MAG: sugar phosphate nucleotidyltransferase [Thaumarchaeota archaeon]|nr:sugar phosphate nucleotidyltransferase [Nitrososphaerota archaeon]
MVVLAGGEGTRMRPLTFTRPKPMLPVGPRPSLHYLLRHLSDQGFNDVVMVVGYLKDQIMGYVGDGSEFGVRVTYVVLPEGLVFGTAGSLKLAAHLLDSTFLVAQGDTISQIPLNEMFEFHRRAERDLTIALTPVERPAEYGVAVVSETDQVTGFQEKPRPEEVKSNLASTGFYILEPEITDYIADDKWDFAKNLFPALMAEGKTISGFVSGSFWADIGSLSGYLKAIGWVLDGMSVEDRDRKGALLGKGVEMSEGCKIQGPSLIEDGVRLGRGVVVSPYSVVKSNSVVSRDSVIRKSVVLEGTTIGTSTQLDSSVIGETAWVGDAVTVSGSIVGQGCRIGRGTKVEVGSRIWPNMSIEEREVVSGIVAVPREKAFYFYTSLGAYTGRMASSIDEFLEAINTVPLHSLEFHMARRDFEKWAKDVVRSMVLADRLRDMRRKGLLGEELKSGLVGCVERWRREVTTNEGSPP